LIMQNRTLRLRWLCGIGLRFSHLFRISFFGETGMNFRLRILVGALLLCGGPVSFLVAQQPLTLADVKTGLPEITADEPVAPEFSAKRAAQYLDRSALNWQKTKNCATCHTNLFYLVARPALTTVQPDSGEVRRFYEDYLNVRWSKKPPSENQGFWPVVVGAGLTFHDAQTTGKLSEVAREVLDLMWTVQRADGGWRWPDCDYAPLEIDDHYGVTVAALAVGMAPDHYADSAQARAGLEKIRKFLRANPAKSLHHRAMLAWCSLRIDGIASPAQRRDTLADLLDRQLDDGGWSTSGLLSDWKSARNDGQPLETKTSDGYGTGFAIVVARELGIPADDARLRRGVDWLRRNQRESGKWFTRSPVSDCGNLMSNVGSAYAVLALQACGELPAGVFGQTQPAGFAP
jgi:squalene-hopene/tetraprenyl-beta-curcumene cyclase